MRVECNVGGPTWAPRTFSAACADTSDSAGRTRANVLLDSPKPVRTGCNVAIQVERDHEIG